MSFGEENLRCMDIINQFHRVSGLKMNVDKTKVITSGEEIDSRDILCEDIKLIWTT